MNTSSERLDIKVGQRLFCEACFHRSQKPQIVAIEVIRIGRKFFYAKSPHRSRELQYDLTGRPVHGFGHGTAYLDRDAIDDSRLRSRLWDDIQQAMRSNFRAPDKLPTISIQSIAAILASFLPPVEQGR